jgi:hypothetical protein
MGTPLEADADAADDGAQREGGRERRGRAVEVTKVQPPSPAALPRQQAKTPLRWSAAESTTAADVSRQRRMLVASEVAARPGVETVPTVEFDMPSVVIVAPEDGSQFAGRARSAATAASRAS